MSFEKTKEYNCIWGCFYAYRRGLSRCFVLTNQAMRRPLLVERATIQVPRLFILLIIHIFLLIDRIWNYRFCSKFLKSWKRTRTAKNSKHSMGSSINYQGVHVSITGLITHNPQILSYKKSWQMIFVGRSKTIIISTFSRTFFICILRWSIDMPKQSSIMNIYKLINICYEIQA